MEQVEGVSMFENEVATERHNVYRQLSCILTTHIIESGEPATKVEIMDLIKQEISFSMGQSVSAEYRRLREKGIELFQKDWQQKTEAVTTASKIMPGLQQSILMPLLHGITNGPPSLTSDERDAMLKEQLKKLHEKIDSPEKRKLALEDVLERVRRS